MPIEAPPRLILASASPRRRQILADLGIRFVSVVPEVEELTDGIPHEVVLENARLKVRAGLEIARPTEGEEHSARPRDDRSDRRARDSDLPVEGYPEVRIRGGDLILGADTDVALDGALLGKASDEAGARERLRALSGRTHEVLGGIVVLSAAEVPVEHAALARTEVTFRPLEDAEIERYLRSGEWRDRAGAYAIQGLGSTLVESLHGDFSNVVGLSIRTLFDLVPALERFLLDSA